MAFTLNDNNVSVSANINGSKLLNASITASKIANSAITTTQISSAAGITGGQIAATTISANNILNATITQQKMGFVTGSSPPKLFSDMTQGLYIRGLVNTTINGTALGPWAANNESTVINQQFLI